jgi:hypothetical protein
LARGKGRADCDAWRTHVRQPTASRLQRVVNLRLRDGIGQISGRQAAVTPFLETTSNRTKCGVSGLRRGSGCGRREPSR